MPHQGLSPAERHAARARAKAIYETIRKTLEASCQGKIVAIEVESGEHFIGETVLEAGKNARTKHPEKVFHFFRVGFPAVYMSR
jgi:hypothetical protein